MRNSRNIILQIIIVSLMLITTAVFANKSHFIYPQNEPQQISDTIKRDVKKTDPITSKDLKKKTIDLRDPENAKTEIVYDENTGGYRIGTKIGDNYLNTPFLMTKKEYEDWSIKKSMREYFAKKNQEDFDKEKKDKFDFTDMKFDLGPAEKIFGPGGVQIKTQGSAEIKIGANTKDVDNPSLPIRNRKTFGFDFDEQININANAKIGDKMDVNLNYNTEASFDFDSKNFKLKYEGKEDEIIKLVEGGNISFPTNNSLIQGASSLFGIRTDMQFGKLKVSAVVSQKKSVSKSVSSKGGTQMTNFEIQADNYEANRHFFLSHFFRRNYDQYMSTLPNISSGITINRIEVWVTNKNNTTTNTRNLVAFTDLAEYSDIYNTKNWHSESPQNPSNTSNNLYSTIIEQYPEARHINQVFSSLSNIPEFEGGIDYEKIENAKLLSSNEYKLNNKLGYISLKTTLQPDQVLAVAYEYTYMGKTYQVGEFSTDKTDNTTCIYVKLLKNSNNTPLMGNWKLMMKNVYNLGATSVESTNFRMDIKYLSDTTGVYLSYLPEESIKNTTLLKLLNLDRLDNKQQAHPNGYFDFIDGYTIDKSQGRIYFPVAEPFGQHIENVIKDKSISDKYTFKELYDSTSTIAKQIIEKDKFVLTGQYKSTSGNEISLGAMNVPQGSVVVTAGGVTLTENTDYSVNYGTGTVTILNQSIIDAGTPINVSLESEGEAMQRKTMLGLNWEYDFSKDFVIGGTWMHLKEQALTTKTTMGNEPLNNTIWGFNFSWKKKSQWLTDMLNKFPLLNLTEPSQINISGEFAKLITGENDQSQGNSSYIDDFENTKNGLDISNPHDWVISSCPLLFPESKLTDNVEYGYNRALLNWYNIDPMFTRRSSSLTPGYIKSDTAQLSNHYIREVYRTELFPNRELTYGESSTLPILNIAYYPIERGPYNLNTKLNNKGQLNDNNTHNHWGGMMRSLETTDFETANIEYIEFWMLDPFIYDRGKQGNFGGDLYINLGDISEDILKDGNKAYESGMGLESTVATYQECAWGKYAKQQAITYAFNTNAGSRAKQDIGLDGLTNAEEALHPSYISFLQAIKSSVSDSVYNNILKDPANDDFHYFRGSDFDAARTPILERYKRINNPEGNTPDTETSPESYSTAYKTTPDVEDINKDFTLNEYNNYYEYKISLNPDSMNVGQGNIVSKRETMVSLRNGNKERVNWYQFRIPLDEYKQKYGNISDFSSIRFMRVFLTNFEEPVILRFGTFELVRGEWRNYEQSLTGKGKNLSGSMDVSAVNIQEHNDKTPVNYVLPPGISRVVDRNQGQLTQRNEQALNITVKNLDMGECRAIYKKSALDLRQYKHIQMFIHANALIGDHTIKDNEMSLFIRMGSDYKNNFYEYEIPLKLTPEGHYDTYTLADCKAVWPDINMLDIDFEKFTKAKLNRNKAKSEQNASYSELYSEYDSDSPNNKISVMGNPSIGNIQTMMIGVRNNSRSTKSVEVWINEMRLQGYTDEGGWAAKGKMDLKLSDLATISATGHIETYGFGGLEQGINERNDADLYDYSITTNIQMGKFFPEKAKIKIPLYYSYNKKKTIPKYNPLDNDTKLEDALDACATKQERDSLEDICVTQTTNSNFSISNARIDIATKTHSMPYDPANFAFSYSHSHKYSSGETTVYEKNDNWRFNVNYNYSPKSNGFQPFKSLKDKSGWLKILQDEKINYVPQNLTINSDITRTYYELQERDMNNLSDNSLPMIWSSDFLWNRSLNLTWDITNNIHASLQTGTNAEVVEPYLENNRSFYHDDYSLWKDSIMQSLKNFGKPLSYTQSFSFSWQLPINKLPAFKWVNTNMSFNSSYNWKRGTTLSNGSTNGNDISNTRDFKINGRFNLEELYNLVPYLKNTNKYYSLKTGNKKSKKDDKKPEKFEQEITLKADTTLTINHKQKNKKLRVIAIRKDGKRYPIKYKVDNNNTITILNKDTISLKLTITPAKKAEESILFKIARATTRFAMMVRNVNISYNNNFSMNLPGFLPNAGDFFGQNSTGCLKPGLDFAFGLVDESYITKAKNSGWLLCNDSVSTPATTNLSENLQLSATLEPIPSLKIDLNAARSVTKARSIQYMYEGMPATQNGSFRMTTISISTAFESPGTQGNGFANKTFNRFLSYLDVFRTRVEAKYEGAPYPKTSQLAGETFSAAKSIENPERYGTINKYSSDVMIPAFLAAYCGGGTNSSLDIFPTLTRLLPNWKISYGGLMRISWFKHNFNKFTLDHSYKSEFNVGSYNTFNSYIKYMGELGFITNATTNLPVPSSMYDISTAAINEAFSPLFGVSATFKNGITTSLRYNKTRIVTLSMTSQQISESFTNDIVVGLQYKINDFKLFGVPKKKKKIVKRRNNKDNEEEQQNKDEEISTGTFNQTLQLKGDFSLRDQSAVNRNILTEFSQATSGNKALKISLSAEYAFSKTMTFSAFYDRQTTTPLLTASSYPTTIQDFGISMKFSLTR